MGKVALRWGSGFIQTSFQHVSVYGILISVKSKDDKDTKSTYAFQKITFVPVRVIVHILWLLEGCVQGTNCCYLFLFRASS